MFRSKSLKSFAFTASLASICLAGSASAVELLVTTTADSGDGSLRAALFEAAESETASQILITAAGDIEIESPLVYEGTAPLGLYGGGQVIKTKENITLLTVAKGADLTISDLSFQGPGGFSIDKRDQDTAGKGIFVDVDEDATGVVRLSLDKVSVSDVAYHGIHISDCDLADDCGFGMGGEGDGSAASIDVRLSDVEVTDVGHGKFDADGVRVDERGEGDIRFTVHRAKFSNAGADGVELDEGQAGSVVARAADVEFSDNGPYCDPALLNPLLPDEPEGEFEEGEKQEADIPDEVTGSPDDACFEREVELYDSGSVAEYEISIDLDDGFDIDEAGEGDLIAVLTDIKVKDNNDEGIDFDEADGGKISFSYARGEVEGQTDDGVKVSEEGADGVSAMLHDVSSKENGGKGIVLEQEDSGDIDVLAVKVRTGGNDDGDKTGLEVVQDGDGEGTLIVRDGDIEDGIDAGDIKISQK